MRAPVLVAALASVLAGDQALACAVVPHAGESARIAEESALVVWDPKRGVEHFIRRAVFDTTASDFGFLVPTPTEPQLGEVDVAVFQKLVDWTQPPRPRPAPESLPAGVIAKAQVASAPPPAVVVLQEAKVAGFDAVVLKANDASALDGWLKKHGYASSPALAAWFKPYVARKWLITAFKVSKAADAAPRAETAAVRMSFRTDRAFYPYREPDGKAAGAAGRALEVFFLGPQRVDGAVGNSAPWPGRALWSNTLARAQRAELSQMLKLPDDPIDADTRLTRFVDLSSPRPGKDELYFAAAADNSTLLDASGIGAENARRAAAALRRASDGPGRPQSTQEQQALMAVANALELKGDFRAAVRVLRRAARAGSGEAALRLVDYYATGKPGVARDPDESRMWYDTAKDLVESPPAMRR
jgi:hypothetical protein